MNTAQIGSTYTRMRHDMRIATGNVIGGGDNTATLHAARRELAAFAEKLKQEG